MSTLTDFNEVRGVKSILVSCSRVDRMDRQTDREVGSLLGVMWVLLWSVVVKIWVKKPNSQFTNPLVIVFSPDRYTDLHHLEDDEKNNILQKLTSSKGWMNSVLAIGWRASIIWTDNGNVFLYGVGSLLLVFICGICFTMKLKPL